MAGAIKTACPGFASYSLLGDGGVEVNGEFPFWAPGSVQEQKLLGAWNQYGSTISAVASEHGIPPAWIVAILVQESGGNPRACSPCEICNPTICAEGAGYRCCAWGLMQFTDETARAYGASGPALMGNPELAIHLAGEFLVDKIAKYGMDLVKLAASYNAGSPRCGKSDSTFGLISNHDYPFSVVKYANTALELGLGAKPPLLQAGFMGGLFAALGIGAAYAIYTGQLKVNV